MALWRTNHWHSELWTWRLSLFPSTSSRPTSISNPPSASETRHSIGRRSFQGIELVSAFNARFPGRPADTIPQLVMSNVNIFNSPPPTETSATTETKVSSPSTDMRSTPVDIQGLVSLIIIPRRRMMKQELVKVKSQVSIKRAFTLKRTTPPM